MKAFWCTYTIAHTSPRLIILMNLTILTISRLTHWFLETWSERYNKTHAIYNIEFEFIFFSYQDIVRIDIDFSALEINRIVNRIHYCPIIYQL